LGKFRRIVDSSGRHLLKGANWKQGLIMREVLLREADSADMQIIESHIERFRLDNENLGFEQFIVAESDGDIVGFGRIKPYKHCYELGCVAVLEAYRNHLIGSAIVRKLIRDFPSSDIWITTGIPGYFQKFGFQLTTNAPGEIYDKIERVCQSRHHPDAVIMLLRNK
jgi:N-acetylglutamate synthase-like GNAT family acetyltransferase